ncbi:hypothetical protein DENSPDRAFT_357101 [Dentipellis sp. KUC8613]|nr:hypothetical protein DENSPDRAFT_357101 [Dentipellis sp. KUC8613]
MKGHPSSFRLRWQAARSSSFVVRAAARQRRRRRQRRASNSMFTLALPCAAIQSVTHWRSERLSSPLSHLAPSRECGCFTRCANAYGRPELRVRRVRSWFVRAERGRRKPRSTRMPLKRGQAFFSSLIWPRRVHLQSSAGLICFLTANPIFTCREPRK